MVNLELYRVFYTVAKCGSLTKAAQELFISQPAVSQSIKQLEGQLGVSLFNRTHRGMELSAAGGKLIFKQVEDALKLLDEAENALSQIRTTPTGTIRIGATDSIFYHFLADKIAEYNIKYPAVRFELISSPSPYTINQLKEGKCDIAFVNLPMEDDDVKFYGTVSHLSDIFVAGGRYCDLKNEPLPIKRLLDLPVIMIEENTVSRRALSLFLDNLGVRLHPDIEVANWDLMIKLAIKGMGVGCIPREYCKKELEEGTLFELPVTPSLPVRGVGIALAKNVQLSFAMKEFISLFEG
ncbi:MAG: LysR family transcriptional regulator [Clostridiales bacterium]|nr:LysR family transcriptional regulator [Clostridiales bacterium]